MASSRSDKLPLEVDGSTFLPRLPDSAHGLNHLAHSPSWGISLYREPALVMSLHLRSKTEHKTPVRRPLKIPRCVSKRHRAEGKRQGNRSTEFHRRGRGAAIARGEDGSCLVSETHRQSYSEASAREACAANDSSRGASVVRSRCKGVLKKAQL